MKLRPKHQYGVTKPSNWREAVEALHAVKKPAPRKSSGLMSRIDTIEQMLKDKK